MFCTNCGNKVPDGSNFCVSCGTRLNAPAAPIQTQPVAPIRPVMPAAPVVPAAAPAGPPIGAQGQIIATPVRPGSTLKCSWCGAVVDGGQNTCPKCGATLNLSSAQSTSGWAKLPGRKDMAKLQFGNSVCQIEGKYVPVADLKLAAEDSVYFTHHVLLWKDPQVAITAMNLKGAWKRMLGGLPLIMTQASGPGHIAFSQDSPGELIAMPLQHGQEIDVREHLFLAATGNVDYDWFQTNIWFQARKDNETETCYPLGRVMDRFRATGAPGLLLLHAAGNVFVRHLEPGQVMLIKPTALVFKDPTVQMDLYFDSPSGGLTAWFSASSGTGYLWLRLVGPGRIAIQSVFDQVEGEGRYVGGSSSSPLGGNMLGNVVMGEVVGDVISNIFDWGGNDN